MSNTMNVHDVSRAIKSLQRRASTLEDFADGRVGGGRRWNRNGTPITLSDSLAAELKDLAKRERNIEGKLRNIIANIQVSVEI